jgi:hypothetical protein
MTADLTTPSRIKSKPSSGVFQSAKKSNVFVKPKGSGTLNIKGTVVKRIDLGDQHREDGPPETQAAAQPIRLSQAQPSARKSSYEKPSS